MNNQSTTPPAIALDALRSGDIQAFSQLYLSLYPPLCFFAESLLHDRAKAEEVVAGVFENLWVRRKKIKEVENIKSYLYTSVHNNCLYLIRQRTRHEKHHKDIRHLTPEAEETVLQNIYYAEALQEVFKAVATLPEQRRKVITMIYGDGLKPEEIAEQLGLSIETVRTHKKLAMAELRKMLSGRALVVAAIIVNSSYNF